MVAPMTLTEREFPGAVKITRPATVATSAHLRLARIALRTLMGIHSLEGLDQEAFGLSSMARPVTPVPSSGLAVAVFPQKTKRFIRRSDVANRIYFESCKRATRKVPTNTHRRQMPSG